MTEKRKIERMMFEVKARVDEPKGEDLLAELDRLLGITDITCRKARTTKREPRDN